MIVARNRAELREGLGSLAGSGVRGLVPTMGALHAGHLSLVQRARERSESVVLSIFVNPTQFGPEEDFEAYPRPLDEDLETAERRGVDLVFAPESETVIYPEGDPVVTVDPGAMADRLCGAHRPGHFRGVLTVVAKLFGLVRPDVAVFGRKDFQQAVLIRRMVRDLELGVEIDIAPLVREEDGLALSSRNAYLSSEERKSALGLYEGLTKAVSRFRGGERRPGPLRRAVEEAVARHPLLNLQYVDVVDSERLEPVESVEPGSVVAVAGFCGETRLIDNVVLE